jgi:carboxyl-terminal processing protease
MRIKILLMSGILTTLLLTGAYTIYQGGGDRGELLVKLIMTGMERYHYQPLAIDDEFSQMVFDEYLKKLDYSRHFFTARDLENLQRFQYRIDDELQNGTFEFFELSLNMLSHRMSQARGFLAEYEEIPFDFDREETYVDDPESLDFPTNEAELRERWRLELKYRTLIRLHDAMERQEEQAKSQPESIGFEGKTFSELEAEARAKTIENYRKYLDRLEDMDLSDRRADYLNAVTGIYDPHTGYFPPKDKENFDISLSGRLEGIGAQLREDGQYIKVVRIVPGSASARQGELQIDDKILKVAQGKEEEPVDIVGMNIDDAVKLIRGPKGTEVLLTVRRPDGTQKEIPITRDVVELEETYAKSAVLRESGQAGRIGYIHLPKFYADFRDRNGRRAATDVAKEVKKLKAEGIDGLILDLRNNGGGSLSDVVEMAGLFVEDGPMVQVKYRDRDPQVLRDRDREVQYEGKLLVLVNSFSASASEILAAAMQDYDRAVIVGSPSTYGKGTVQLFVNLDDFIRGSSEVKPLGEIKLTTQKFYRINGDATQLKGVIPDIVLPDEYSLLDMGEKDYKHSMAWDEIEPVDYQPWEKPASAQTEDLRINSARRVATSQTFRLIRENAERFRRRQERESYPLELTAFRTDRERIEEEGEKYKDLRQTIDAMQIDYLRQDMAHIDSDTLRQKRYAQWHSNLRKDPYLFEAMQILQDMQ